MLSTLLDLAGGARKRRKSLNPNVPLWLLRIPIILRWDPNRDHTKDQLVLEDSVSPS